jgi:hypothetical protein
MEQTIILNSGQKIEVYMPDKIELDIDCHVAYIKSGQAEIQNYVDKVSKPEIDTYVTANSEPLVREIVIQKTQPLIEKYVNTDVLPALAQYVTKSETLLNQTTAVADIATQAQNAALESATEASVAATSAATAADKAEASVQTVGEMLDTKAEDSAVVHLTGDETIGGVKTFVDNITAPNIADTELSNLADGVKASVAIWGMPDYDSGIEIWKTLTTTKSSFTAPSNGYFACYFYASGSNGTVVILPDNTMLVQGAATVNHASWVFPLLKGQTISMYGDTRALSGSARFYPLKGETNA